MSLKSIVAADIGQELDATRRVIAAIPGDRIDWKPHERSWSIGGLAQHVANLPMWSHMVLGLDELDLAQTPPPSPPPESIADVLEAFDRHRANFEEALEAATTDGLMATWTLRKGETVLQSAPRAVVLRSAGVSHMVHHRGQLTVYLRLLDIPVPETYGPTADSSEL